MSSREGVLRSFLSRARGFRGVAAVEGGKVYLAGEITREQVERAAEAFSFASEVLRKARGIGVKVLVAEGEGGGLVYAKYGFTSYVVAVYRDIPLGVAYHEVKRLVAELAG